MIFLVVVLSTQREKKREKLRSPEETDVNEVSVQSSSNLMPTGQRYGGEDLLLPLSTQIYNIKIRSSKLITKSNAQ